MKHIHTRDWWQNQPNTIVFTFRINGPPFYSTFGTPFGTPSAPLPKAGALSSLFRLTPLSKFGNFKINDISFDWTNPSGIIPLFLTSFQSVGLTDTEIELNEQSQICLVPSRLFV